MNREIYTCVQNTHGLYDGYSGCNFAREGIRVGVAYRVVEHLTLTSPQYIRPQYAALRGVTVIAGIGWKWKRSPCLPAECFRPATGKERAIYWIKYAVWLPWNALKKAFAKVYWPIRMATLSKAEKEFNEQFF